MTAPILHGGGLARAAALHGGSPGDWLDLSTGINPCPPALPEIVSSVWHRLPDADLLLAARRAAAAFYGTGDALPLAVPGTQSVIQHLPGLAPEGRTAVILGPTYGEYERVLRRAGRAVEIVTSPGALAPEHGLAIVVNPDNPTGRIVAPADIMALADRMAARGGLLLVDEAFADTVPEASVAALTAGHPGLVVFRSFGKFFGMAGLRLGFVMAAPDRLQALGEALGPWAVSGPALAAADALFTGDIAAIRRTIAARKTALDGALTAAGLKIVGGTALFSLVEDARAPAIHSSLCDRRILTRAFDYAPRWLRFGLAPDAASDARLAGALRRAVA